MPKLAKSIEVKCVGDRVSLTIDGEEFGYYLARDPITTTTELNEFGTVSLTLVAERVTVEDDTGHPVGARTSDIDCSDHQPQQHRDGKPPWCNHCGLTSDGREPVSRFRQ